MYLVNIEINMTLANNIYHYLKQVAEMARST